MRNDRATEGVAVAVPGILVIECTTICAPRLKGSLQGKD